jgi:hypothetical protein
VTALPSTPLPPFSIIFALLCFLIFLIKKYCRGFSYNISLKKTFRLSIFFHRGRLYTEAPIDLDFGAIYGERRTNRGSRLYA